MAHKCAPPFRVAEFDIRWGTGIDGVGSLLDKAIAAGVVDKRGAHLSLGGERLGQGREKARQAIIARQSIAAALREALALPALEEVPHPGAPPAAEKQGKRGKAAPTKKNDKAPVAA